MFGTFSAVQNPVGLTVPLGLLAGAGVGEALTNRRCRQTIEKWARDNGLRVTASRRLWVWAKAWGFKTEGRNGRFFTFAVVGADGQPRRAQAKVFGGFGGYSADQIQVRWTDLANS